MSKDRARETCFEMLYQRGYTIIDSKNITIALTPIKMKTNSLLTSMLSVKYRLSMMTKWKSN
jgi:hypothetical protein